MPFLGPEFFVTHHNPDTTLGSNLPIVAQMIDGNLGSRIYHVNLTGFDTHSNQLLRHAELLDNLFRRLYSTVLSDWFGIPAEDVLSVFESEYERFPFIESTSTVGTDDANVPITFTLDP